MKSSIPIAKAKRASLIVFDLDGTLAESKSSMDPVMARLFAKLLEQKKVAVISGGRFSQFVLQLLDGLKDLHPRYTHLFLFPTTSTSFYRHRAGRWKRIYAHEFSKSQKQKIMRAFARVFAELDYRHPKKVYGPVIEDRGTQITFSALGQNIVAALGKKGVRLKEQWTRTHTPLKLKIAGMLQKYLPDLEVHAAGFTSIDVTAKGIDKAYGIRQIRDHLKVPIREMLFVGDAIFPGGNDYAVVKTGVAYVKVKNPDDTKRLIRTLLGGS